MKEELNKIVKEEINFIKILLQLLEKQHTFILEGNVNELEACVEEIQSCSKSIAECEVKRRKITNGESMMKLVREIGDEELENNYRNIKKLLQETTVQKESNELLLKQSISFTTRILSILNPDRSNKTYNSYGKIMK